MALDWREKGLTMKDDQKLEALGAVQSGVRPKPEAGRAWRFVLMLLLFVILVILGIGSWQGYHLSLRISEQDQKLETVQPSLERTGARLAQVETQMEILSQAQGEFLQALKDQTSKIDGLDQRASQQGLTWQLAEIQTQLRMAALAINAFQDIGLALEFLQAAKKAAGELDFSALAMVTAAINQDIGALMLIPRVNRTELYLTIDQLRISLDGLALPQPIARVQEAPPEPVVLTGSTFERLKVLWQALVDRMLHLVDFRRGQPGPGPIPTQTEETVLRQNIALSLTTAQIALLRREQIVFEGSLDRVSTLLDHYFDAQAGPVSSAKDVIRTLKTTPLDIALPTVDNSLTALEKAKLTLGERP